MAEQNIRHIVRVVNTDLDGHKQILNALRKIKGVSFMYANMICSLTGVDNTQKAGTLDQSTLEKLEKALLNPHDHGIPEWMFNRRNDYETGEDLHLVGPNLKYVQDTDIRRLKKIKSNRGLRHAWNLPVRGQRTKSNFRRTKGKALGVKKKK